MDWGPREVNPPCSLRSHMRKMLLIQSRYESQNHFYSPIYLTQYVLSSLTLPGEHKIYILMSKKITCTIFKWMNLTCIYPCGPGHNWNLAIAYIFYVQFVLLEECYFFFLIKVPLYTFLQIAADYGIDWTGPHPSNVEGVTIPDALLPRRLTDAEVSSLPNPAVPLSAALQAYMQTVYILRDILQT